MIDYIEAIKCTGKDTPFLDFREQVAEYASGWQRYNVEGCEKLQLDWNPSARQMKLRGSLAYYWQGHNFTCQRSTFIEAVEYLQGVLNVGLWDSSLLAFEFGAIMPVERKPKYYIQNHHTAAGEKLTENERGKDKGCFKWWEGSGEVLKMYDVQKNILLKQGLERRAIIEGAGWDPMGNYLKFEVKFTNPEKLLVGGGPLLLEKLQEPAFISYLQQVLLQQYKRLGPMKTLKPPKDKGELTTADIILRELLEDWMNKEGISIQEAYKGLCGSLNAYPDTLLTKVDKDHRRRQIKALFQKLEENPCSQWDISGKLEAALAAEQ